MPKLFLGVGLNDIGLSREDKDNKSYIYRAYILWQGMLVRCYTTKERSKYKTYKGCKVCSRWHTFSNFVADLPKIPNYDLWLNNPNSRIALDKDIRGKYHNYYCLHYCMFVTASTNNKEKCNRSGCVFSDPDFIRKRSEITGHSIYSINTKTGFIKEYISIRECARFFNCDSVCIRRALKQKEYIYRDHIFNYLPKESVV